MPKIPRYEEKVSPSFRPSYRRPPSKAAGMAEELKAQELRHQAGIKQYKGQQIQRELGIVQDVASIGGQVADFKKRLDIAEGVAQLITAETGMTRDFNQFILDMPKNPEQDPDWYKKLPEKWDEYRQQSYEKHSKGVTQSDALKSFNERYDKASEKYRVQVEGYTWKTTVDRAYTATLEGIEQAIENKDMGKVIEYLNGAVTSNILSAEKAFKLRQDAEARIKFTIHLEKAMSMPLEEGIKYLNDISQTADLTRSERNEIITSLNRLKGLEEAEKKIKEEKQQDDSYMKVIADMEAAKNGDMSFELIRGRIVGEEYPGITPEQSRSFLKEIDSIADKKEKTAKVKTKVDTLDRLMLMWDDVDIEDRKIRDFLFEEHGKRTLSDGDFKQYVNKLKTRTPDITKQQILKSIDDYFKKEVGDETRQKKIDELNQQKADVVTKFNEWCNANPEIGDPEKWAKYKDLMEPYTVKGIMRLFKRSTGEELIEQSPDFETYFGKKPDKEVKLKNGTTAWQEGNKLYRYNEELGYWEVYKSRKKEWIKAK